MKGPGILSQKVTPVRAMVVIVALAIPAFLWFKFLYVQYVVIPNQISPTMRKMRDGIMQMNARKSPPAPPASTSGPKNPSGEKGANKDRT